jgi:hypothetical protein
VARCKGGDSPALRRERQKVSAMKFYPPDLDIHAFRLFALIVVLALLENLLKGLKNSTGW